MHLAIIVQLLLQGDPRVFFASSTPCNLMIDFAKIPCRCSDILFFSFTVHQNNITTHCLLFFSIKTVLNLVTQLIKKHFVQLQICINMKSRWKCIFFHRILRKFSWRIQIEIRVERSILNLAKHKPKGLIQVRI